MSTPEPKINTPSKEDKMIVHDIAKKLTDDVQRKVMDAIGLVDNLSMKLGVAMGAAFPPMSALAVIFSKHKIKMTEDSSVDDIDRQFKKISHDMYLFSCLVIAAAMSRSPDPHATATKQFKKITGRDPGVPNYA